MLQQRSIAFIDASNIVSTLLVWLYATAYTVSQAMVATPPATHQELPPQVSQLYLTFAATILQMIGHICGLSKKNDINSTAPLPLAMQCMPQSCVPEQYNNSFNPALTGLTLC